MQIPYSAEQGIILAEQAIFAGEQGVYRPKLKSSSDEIFGTKSLWKMSALPPLVDSRSATHRTCASDAVNFGISDLRTSREKRAGVNSGVNKQAILPESHVNPKQQRGTPSHIVSQLPYNLRGSWVGAWQN